MVEEAVAHLVRNIVNFPDDISVESYENSRGRVVRVSVNPQDIGRVIGRAGRTASSLRIILQAISDCPTRLNIVDSSR